MRQREPANEPRFLLRNWLDSQQFSQDEFSRLMFALDPTVRAKRHKINRVLMGHTEFSAHERRVVERLTKIAADAWLPADQRKSRAS